MSPAGSPEVKATTPKAKPSPASTPSPSTAKGTAHLHTWIFGSHFHLKKSLSVCLKHPRLRSLPTKSQNQNPNNRKPNPRVHSRCRSTGSWRGSCLSSAASRTLLEASWGKKLWTWEPNTDRTGPQTPHTLCKCYAGYSRFASLAFCCCWDEHPLAQHQTVRLMEKCLLFSHICIFLENK